MGWFLEHAYIIPLIPAASFCLILFFGKRLPYKGAEIGIAALGVCFALALATNFQWREYVERLRARRGGGPRRGRGGGRRGPRG